MRLFMGDSFELDDYKPIARGLFSRLVDDSREKRTTINGALAFNIMFSKGEVSVSLGYLPSAEFVFGNEVQTYIPFPGYRQIQKVSNEEERSPVATLKLKSDIAERELSHLDEYANLFHVLIDKKFHKSAERSAGFFNGEINFR